MEQATINEIRDFEFTPTTIRDAITRLVDGGIVTDETIVRRHREFARGFFVCKFGHQPSGLDEREIFDDLVDICAAVPTAADHERLMALKRGW